MTISMPRGTQDILPSSSDKWQYIESTLHNLLRQYRYQEIRTPIFESTALFVRGVGDTTDIVQKEMYTFQDKGGRSITLRPEGTAGTIRSYIEHKLYADVTQPQKLYYMGPMFRYERKQKGRYRQFNQFGVEVIGVQNPQVDAEVIALAVQTFKTFGLNNIKVLVNTLGEASERQKYNEDLKAYFRPHIHEFCSDCQARLEKNPMRILDCKVDANHPLMKTVPSLHDYLSPESQAYFDQVINYLDMLEIPYEIDPKLVRGLDYYTHTAFEIVLDNPQIELKTLCGGGRYNGLVEMLGGPQQTGIGFGLGVERLLLALEDENISLPIASPLDVYIVTLGERANHYAVKLLNDLRIAGYSAEKDYFDKKMKAQMKIASRYNAQYTIIIGDEELSQGSVQIKNMLNFEQQQIEITNIEQFLKQQLKEK